MNIWHRKTCWWIWKVSGQKIRNLDSNYDSAKGSPVFMFEGKYTQADPTVMKTLLSDRFLSLDESHQGLILHSVYHRPDGWNHIPEDQSVPCGESSMRGDYHARKAALYVQRLAKDEPYLTFF